MKPTFWSGKQRGRLKRGSSQAQNKLIFGKLSKGCGRRIDVAEKKKMVAIVGEGRGRGNGGEVHPIPAREKLARGAHLVHRGGKGGDGTKVNNLL